MLTAIQTNGTRMFKPKRFNSPLYAVYELVKLEQFEFILFRGKVIQQLQAGWRAEVGRGKWSRVFKSPLKAIEQCLSAKNSARGTRVSSYRQLHRWARPSPNCESRDLISTRHKWRD